MTRPPRPPCPALALALALAACGSRPARFADRPPVVAAADTAPISVPLVRRSVVPVILADVYVGRALVRALDPRRTPDAADVGSLDEVVASSWYAPPGRAAEPLAGCTPDGPPEEPLVPTGRPVASDTPRAVAVRDRRGLDYELLLDAPHHPAVRSAAAVTASRLFCALGYRSAETWIAHVPPALLGPPHRTLAPGEPPPTPDASGRVRVAAQRWPVGVDLGPTPLRGTRPDDPNDVVPHVDRRSLRALELFAGWVQLDAVLPRMLRDAYVGVPALGHVEHFLVELGGALGADTLAAAEAEARNPDRSSNEGFFFKLFTLGMSPRPAPPSTATPHPGVGQLGEDLAPEAFTLSPPYEPGARLLGSDAYWAAERLDALPAETLRAAIAAAELPAAASTWLAEVLAARRRVLLAHGYGATTPLEVANLEPARAGAGPALVLADLALAAGLAEPGATHYTVELLDDEGEPVAAPRVLVASGPTFRLPLPAGALEGRDYLVVRITSATGDTPRPRAFEAHLRPTADGVRLLGVRH
ncbi:MAG: hypothetical protein HY908_36245 [Myxococcales bacterium]|nr:hypothetical protein [Myxococcales bacterium]